MSNEAPKFYPVTDKQQQRKLRALLRESTKLMLNLWPVRVKEAVLITAIQTYLKQR